jgi:hypothetical protein
MIRTLSILAALPCLAGCNLDDLINPGASSKAAWEAREAITTPVRTQVAEIPVPAAVDVPEPVYVAPEPPAPYVPPPPPPECTASLYMIFDCRDGKVFLL